LITWLCTRYTP